MNRDSVKLSCHVWQQRLLSLANEMEAIAERENFHLLYEVRDLLNDAMAKIDEVKPMEPSLDTHFPIVFMDEDTFEPALYWVHRTTGEMVYMFHLEAAINFEAVTGIDREESYRELTGGYSKEELNELQARMRSEFPLDSPEYDRLRTLAFAWKEQQS